MPVEVAELAVGKCYSKGKQVRRIVSLASERVIYESRGRRAGTWNSRQPVKKENFAKTVDREVHCDWDADFGGPSL